MTIAANGAYSYTVDNNNATVQALRHSGQSVTDVFTYSMLDASGATAHVSDYRHDPRCQRCPYRNQFQRPADRREFLNGTAVGTVTGVDIDSGETWTYSLSDSAAGRFSINNSGVISVSNGSLLNYEAATSHSITVVATDAGGLTYSKSFTISLSDVNEFSVTAPVDSNPGANSVNENATNGTLVGITVSSTDADATSNSVTYSLADNAGGRFTINSTTGIVTVADGSMLDREATASYNITVRATSADNSFADSVFTILLNDVNEF